MWRLQVHYTHYKTCSPLQYSKYYNVITFRVSVREYKVTKKEESKWSKAMTICEDLGLGLAMWDTNEAFKDLRTITGSSSGFFDKPAWTALNNANKKSCDGSQSCNGKLVT